MNQPALVINIIKPIKISCADHSGGRSGRVQQWDGRGWKLISDWYTADEDVTEPLVKEVSAKYAAARNIAPRDCDAAAVAHQSAGLDELAIRRDGRCRVTHGE
jgi:hypothetical protein